MKYNIQVVAEASFLQHATPLVPLIIFLFTVHQLSCEREKDIKSVSREKARVGCFERTASKYVYYLGWNRSPAQVGCMRQVLGPGALGRPRGIGWRGRWERGSG